MVQKVMLYGVETWDNALELNQNCYRNGFLKDVNE